MSRIWPEERIREEMRKLDKITGLNGASLPIEFGYARCRLGYFKLSNRKPEKFYFSKAYLEDEGFLYEEAIDLIRHEYAHYMDWMIFGQCGHGKTWKKCCNDIGADPTRLYDTAKAKILHVKFQKDQELGKKCDMLEEGVYIIHPKYDSGTVEGVEKDGIHRMVYIYFPNVGVKKMSAKWIIENCACDFD